MSDSNNDELREIVRRLQAREDAGLHQLLDAIASEGTRLPVETMKAWVDLWESMWSSDRNEHRRAVASARKFLATAENSAGVELADAIVARWDRN